jgi:hypothetical protein
MVEEVLAFVVSLCTHNRGIGRFTVQGGGEGADMEGDEKETCSFSKGSANPNSEK